VGHDVGEDAEAHRSFSFTEGGAEGNVGVCAREDVGCFKEVTDPASAGESGHNIGNKLAALDSNELRLLCRLTNMPTFGCIVGFIH